MAVWGDGEAGNFPWEAVRVGRVAVVTTECSSLSGLQDGAARSRRTLQRMVYIGWRLHRLGERESRRHERIMPVLPAIWPRP